MTNLYEPVIGLEIHVELNTKSKMFCSCSAQYFGSKPNTHTCPVCLGLPGALPSANTEALESCIKIGLALGCKVSEKSRFERKNYFYPDLPKGYQISQYRWPLTVGGEMEVVGKSGKRTIRINRAHMEEDTAKLVHQFGITTVGARSDQLPTSNEGEKTLIDFNRSGVPLVEIVTEPDFHDSEEIRDYAKKLQQICRYLKVSNADMERGDMRLEANISVRRVGVKELPPYRVELKNINSFRFMVAAVEYEIKRQSEALENGERLFQETRGWDENKKQTYSQRKKEEANDYRYFPEPDLSVVSMKYDVSRIEAEMPELPAEKIKRFVDQYNLTEQQSVILTDTQELANYFEECVKVGIDHNVDSKKIANTLINKKFDRKTTLPADLIKILREESEKPEYPESELESAVDKVISENPDAVEDFKNGKDAILQFLLGQVMKETKGRADPEKAREMLLKKM